METDIWNSIRELTNVAKERASDPLRWALQISSRLSFDGISLPSPELSDLLVAYILWENNVPLLWKFLEKAMVLKLVPSLLVLALLSSRIMPRRRSEPGAYRLYLELVRRYGFELEHLQLGQNPELTQMAVGSALLFGSNIGVKAKDNGVLIIEFVFSIFRHLLGATMEDELISEVASDNQAKGVHLLEIHYNGINKYANEAVYYSKLRKENSALAIELIDQFLQNRVTSQILFLARQNLPKEWNKIAEWFHLLGEKSLGVRKSWIISLKKYDKNISKVNLVLRANVRISSCVQPHAALGSKLLAPFVYHGVRPSALWLPLDMALEDAVDGYKVNAVSAIELVTGLVKTLKAITGTSWHDTFLSIWLAALRLVQRGREPIEGPIPCLDARLCILFSIIPLVICELIDEDEAVQQGATSCGTINSWKDKHKPGRCHKSLISSLKFLGDYKELLRPPESVVAAASLAATKAFPSTSTINDDSGSLDAMSIDGNTSICDGNLHHLIVEACIARNLLDGSAYSCPSCVLSDMMHSPDKTSTEIHGWSSFTNGASLSPLLVESLVSSPASSLAEIEKIFKLAVEGSVDEKLSAARVICGASLLRGWNIQEHTVHLIIRLLSPAPGINSLNHNYLNHYAPILNVIIVGIATIDCIQIFSMHGLVPHLACALMPICEVFGSCVPDDLWTLPSGEEISVHTVFSNAFVLLLMLWRFNHPPLDHGVGDVPTVGSQLTPEYLLSLRNSHLESRNKKLKGVAISTHPEAVFVDSFPRLKAWYRLHQRCIASTLSGLVQGTPLHHIVTLLLHMMFGKIHHENKSLNSSSGSCSSTENAAEAEDSLNRPKLPAWEVLEAVPFVVDAALTACAHGRLSPRDLATGLKCLTDFLPASLATIVSFLSAEVSRGVWRPVHMNGTDWPSPAPNLTIVEEQIKKILAATGVHVPSIVTGGATPAALPLPLAAFVSLTITYKIDKASERFLNLAGPALESLAAGCPWPCMPIVASLWTQKAKRWFNFLVFSASRTVFLNNSETVFQLLRSCFASTLDLSCSDISSNGGVGALLGHGFGCQVYGGIASVAPGILYLRAHRAIRDIVFIAGEIIRLLMHCTDEIAKATRVLPAENLKKMRTPHTVRYRPLSLCSAMARVKLAASLGASLIWISGGFVLVHSLFKETLPSWFITAHNSVKEGHEGILPMLRGQALAYFAVLCGALAWGVDSSSSASKRRSKVLGLHMEFMASALDGKISLGCDLGTWRSYASEFVRLMVGRTPCWVHEANSDVLKRLAKGLKKWNEKELALAMLCNGGIDTMAAAAEMIVS